MQETDEQLVAAYLENHDQRAFTMLVERHKDRIYGYLMGMVRDREVANDLFQETFLRVIAAMNDMRGSYEQRGRWIYWVTRIARNATLDYLRSRKKWQDVGTKDDDEVNFWDQLKDESPDAATLLHRAEQREWLETCIDKLPDEQREVLMLRHDAGLTFREIAAMTGCSINTALGRMRYALLNLQKIMAQTDKIQLANLKTE